MGDPFRKTVTPARPGTPTAPGDGAASATGATRTVPAAPSAPGVAVAAPAPAIRIGCIDYLNCLPVYFGIEQGAVRLDVTVEKGPPAVLNRAFLHGRLDVTPISSIEYARHAGECVIIPGLAISADGRVASILLFHRRPLEELDGRPVALTAASATSVVLTRIILELRYGVRPVYRVVPPDLEAMLAEHDAALLIGDDALLAAHTHPEIPHVDLGVEWKAFTGHPMVYALWVARRELAEADPAALRLVTRVFHASQEYSWDHRPEMVAEGVARRGLPPEVVDDYFDLIRHEFGPRYRRGLVAFYERARRLGELGEVPPLRVWGED
ncbi:MAG: menaquinone biosynthesis protein [Symbiobacterium sp.]|uniref:menaquinone biosynthetic enzyme MqnA/MqnD family protein n=1 Tax=Symbiobacterium sp. TaxID=1971213 RepID=UPI003464A33F